MLDGWTHETARPIIEGAVAGIVAEAMATTEPLWTDAHAYLALAKQLADDACPTEEEANSLQDVCIEGANRILTKRWPSVVTIANVLYARGEIDGSELESLLAGRAPIPTPSAS